MAKLIDARLSPEIEQDAQFDIYRRVEIVEMANGFEERNTPQAHHRRRISLVYGAHQTAQIEEVRAAWMVALGPIYAFRFKDWSDYKTSAGGSAPGNADQSIGAGDGIEVDFQLSKTVSFGATSYAHPIKAPVDGSLLVAVAGVAQVEGVDFTADYDTGLITFTAAPADTLAITAGCMFDVWVRFEGESFSMSHLLFVENDASQQVSETGEITLIEVLE